MPSLSDVKVTITTDANLEGVHKVNESLGNLNDEAEHRVSGLSSKTAAIAGAMAGAVQSLAMTGINMITSTVNTAITRVDTLNNSAKVFGNLGFAADDVHKAMKSLNDSILGLPTSLDQGVRGMESLALQSGNIKDAQKVFTAFNDAVLSSGHSTGELDNAINQITQLDMKGPLDAQTWNSLKQSGLEPAMKAMANMATNGDMGKLKDEFGEGKLKVEDFMNMLKKLDTDGTGHMASLNKQAHDMTGGIQTGMDNAKTAIARGIADILNAIGSSNISKTISTIGSAVESVGKGIANNIEIIKPILAILGPVLTGILAVASAIKIAAAAQAIWNAVTAANPWVILAAVVIAAIIIIAEHWKTITELFKKGWSDIKQWGLDVWNWIKGNWPLLVGILLGPFAFVVAEIAKHWQTIKNGAANVVQSIGNFFSGLWGSMKSGFDNAYNGMMNWAKRTVDDIVSFFKGLPGRISGAVGNISGKVAGDIKGAFHSLHFPGFASGGFTGAGDMNEVAGIVHRGEYVLPQSQVDQNTGLPKHTGGTTISTNFYGNITLGDDGAVERFFNKLDQDTLLAARGLTPNRGMR